MDVWSFPTISYIKIRFIIQLKPPFINGWPWGSRCLFVFPPWRSNCVGIEAPKPHHHGNLRPENRMGFWFDEFHLLRGRMAYLHGCFLLFSGRVNTRRWFQLFFTLNFKPYFGKKIQCDYIIFFNRVETTKQNIMIYICLYIYIYERYRWWFEKKMFF